MKFQLKTFLSSIGLLLATVRSDDVKLFTSDGVVYSYAVVTSTIAPPSVRVETHYYTTTRVREITLDNSEVKTTTENVISASEVTSTAQSTSTTSDESTSSTVTSSSSSSTSQAAQASPSKSVSILQPASTGSMTSSTESASTISTTSSTSPSSTSSSLGSSVTPYSTVTGSDGSCSVYYEDDEYYSTAYLTDPSQSVDAATTITSTMLVYETLTLA